MKEQRTYTISNPLIIIKDQEKNDYDDQEGDVWMFGIGIKKKRGKKKKIPIYIKIYITKVNGAPNFCISFHKAKFDMVFPYKQEL